MVLRKTETVATTTKMNEQTATITDFVSAYTNSANAIEGAHSDSILYETIVYSITIPLLILTAMGNGVILLTIKFQARLLSSTSNYFILSLAFADFFVGVVIMPIMIVYTANKQVWKYSQLLCDSWMSIDFLCSSASFLTLSMMSIERYKMLTNSYGHIKHSSKLRILIFIALSWLIPLVSWLPTVVISRYLSQSNQPGDCSLAADKYLILALCVVVYHIPLVFMIIFYTKLIVYIKKLLTNSESSQSEAAAMNSPNRRNRLSAGNQKNSFYNNRLSGQNQSLTNYYENEATNKSMSWQYSIRINRNLKTSASIRSNKIYSSNTQKSNLFAKLNVILPCCFLNNRNRNQQVNQDQLQFNRKVQMRATKNLNFDELIQKKSQPDVNANMQNRILRFQWGEFNNHTNDQQQPCHFTITSRSQNNNKNLNEAAGNSQSETNDMLMNSAKINNRKCNRGSSLATLNQKEFSSELTSHEKKCSIVMATTAPIMLKKKDSSAQVKLFENSNYQNLRLKRNRKAARMLGILVAAFMICWLPFTILYPLSQFYPNLLPTNLTIIIWWMGYFNSTINPFLYVYSNKNIRRSVRILFCKRLWSYCTRKPVSKNFRSDSLKNQVAIYPNVFVPPNIYKRNSSNRQTNIPNIPY